VVLWVRAEFPEEFGGYESTVEGLWLGHVANAATPAAGGLGPLASRLIEEAFVFVGLAAVWMPAGFRALPRRDGALAAMCGVWIAGYVVICSPIGDFGYGGYYVATAGVQAIVGVHFLVHATASPWRLGAALAAGAIVLTSFQLAPDWLVPIYLVCAGLVLAIPPGPERPARSLGLAAAVAIAAAFVALYEIPRIRYDPVRRRAEAVLARTSRDSILIFGDADTGIAGYEYFFAEVERPKRNVVPGFLDIWPEGEVAALRDRWESEIARQLAAGGDVWYMGDPAAPAEGAQRAVFDAWLRERCQLFPASDGSERLYRVARK
jgi:hypothetical protein